jgi:hypothetical protein
MLFNKIVFFHIIVPQSSSSIIPLIFIRLEAKTTRSSPLLHSILLRFPPLSTSISISLSPLACCTISRTLQHRDTAAFLFAREVKSERRGGETERKNQRGEVHIGGEIQ